MRILSLLIICLVMAYFNQETNSPHGKNFKVSCSNCHSAKGWQLDKSIYSFDHARTKFALRGQHEIVNCRECHSTLVFSEAKNECNECHADVHQGTTGVDCQRCHTPASWLVNNIAGIHRMSRFPLLGAHTTADCSDCHKSESMVRFDVVGVNCIDCHRADYMATTNPNHIQSGMSEDCSVCHQMNSFEWTNGGFNHSFFSLAQGHSAVKCTECHTTGNYADASPECYSCHQQDYLGAAAPNHSASQFSTVCTNCHTLSPGWKPAAFDHSAFPLTLGHSGLSCVDCHTGGNYTALPTDCNNCHLQDFNSATNPSHTASGFSTVCTQCHTTNPGWKPTTFNHNIFPLTLGHSTPACIDCHKGGNYTNTPTDCYACHSADYTATTNPNHISAGIPQTCLTCHTTNPGWQPASYAQHDSQYFPIYSGKHRGEWTTCNECHTTPGNYALFNCITCHSNAHTGQNYTNDDCFRCHPTGNSD
jgi:hypothetical protein